MAMAQFAKQKGVKRLFLSWNPTTILGRLRRRRGSAAQYLGIQIAGAAPFNPEARNYDSVRSPDRSRPAPTGSCWRHTLPPSTPALLRDLRAGLGPRVTLIGSEGFLPILPRSRAGRPRDVHRLPRRGHLLLPPAGKRFLKELKARTGKPSEFYTASAAQSAEILLDAIARSDGTRASVTKELFKTRVENGILGDIRFDKNGDPVEAPVTIWRIVRHPRDPLRGEAPARPSSLMGIGHGGGVVELTDLGFVVDAVSSAASCRRRRRRFGEPAAASARLVAGPRRRGVAACVCDGGGGVEAAEATSSASRRRWRARRWCARRALRVLPDGYSRDGYVVVPAVRARRHRALTPPRSLAAGVRAARDVRRVDRDGRVVPCAGRVAADDVPGDLEARHPGRRCCR